MIENLMLIDKFLKRRSSRNPVTKEIKSRVSKSASAIFCKSFSPDIPRLKILLKSIVEHNANNLSVFVAVPHKEFSLFKRELSGEITLIPEEEFVEPRCFSWLDGWRQQQVVKLCFHRLDLCERYLWIDSDSYFIKDFREADIFGMGSKIPLIVSGIASGENTENDILALRLGKKPRKRTLQTLPSFDPAKELRIARAFLHDKNYKNFPPEAAQSLIPYSFRQRPFGQQIEFYPAPIFYGRILSEFEKFLTEQKLSFVDLIHLSPWEAYWYGYYAMKFFADEIIPVEPHFTWMISDAEINQMRTAGVSIKSMATNYFGVALAARHQSDLEF